MLVMVKVLLTKTGVMMLLPLYARGYVFLLMAFLTFLPLDAGKLSEGKTVS